MKNRSMEFHLSFNVNDPFETAVYRALRTLPRGYAKLFFMRTARLFFGDERSTKRMARVMFDFGTDVRPQCVTRLPVVEYKHGEPSQMLMYYPPTVEQKIPKSCYRTPKNQRKIIDGRLRAINSMQKDEPPKVVRKEKKTSRKDAAKKAADSADDCATGARPKKAAPTPAPAPAPAAAANDNVACIDKQRKKKVLSRLCWG